MNPGGWLRRSLIFLVRAYQTWISPTRMPSCRFEPTCSTYAVEALDEWGALRGGALAVWRLLKCGPWHKPGYDPVPQRNRHHGLVTGAEAGDDPEPRVPDADTSSVSDAEPRCVSDASTRCVSDAVRSN